jgi:hypothetical protein
MFFPTHFKRQKGGGTSDPVLGAASDPAPVFADGENKVSGATPLWVGAKLGVKIGGIGNPIRRIAVGYRFDDGAAGVGVNLTNVTLWIFDKEMGKWFQCSTGTLVDGQITYFRAPYLADPPQTQANLQKMEGGCLFLLIVPDNAGANGTYHFLMGPDLAEF